MRSTWPGFPTILERVEREASDCDGGFQPGESVWEAGHLGALRLALLEAFEPKLRIVTADLAFQGRKSIDHIALSEDWAVDSVDAISNIHEGRKVSDHFGVAADVLVEPVR